MLRDHDKTAIFALLVRQVEAQEARAEAEEILAAAKATLSTTAATMASIRAALGIFGFDMSAEKPWDAVRDAIGTDEYSKAIHIGKGEAVQLGPVEGQTSLPSEQNRIDGKSEKISDLHQPKIRELVTEQLIKVGTDGIKAVDVKQFIASQGIEIHDKTVGMTLYRLSKEGISRREGRTWFHVPSAKKNEPLDGKSGQDASKGSDHQPDAQGGEARPGGGP